MQPFQIAGSVAALAFTIALIGWGGSIMVKIGNPKRGHAIMFFSLSILMFVLYIFLWQAALRHSNLGVTLNSISDNTSMPSVATENTGLGQLGQILGGGIVAAILTLAVRELISRWKRPKLEVDFKNALIFLRENTDTGRESYWLRIRVMNSGRSVAKGCTGRITKFMNDSGQIDYDPLILHWIEVPWECKPFRAVDLRRQEERYLDILVQKAEDPTKLFLFAPPLYDPAPLNFLKELPTGTSWIEIAIYGENAEPCSKKYQIMTRGNPIKWDGKNIKWDNDHLYKAIRLEIKK